VKRLSPQPVVTSRLLVMENTSPRHQGHPGTRSNSPDVTPQHDGLNPAAIHIQPPAARDSTRSALSPARSRRTTSQRIGTTPSLSKQMARGGGDRFRAETSRMQCVSPAIGPVVCPRRSPAANTPHVTPRGFQITHFKPYFSSSLTLSIRGAVSPARHVLTRPRPHPVFREEEFRIAGAVVGTQRSAIVTSLSTVDTDLRRRTAGYVHVSHSPAPWQSRGRAGMLSCRAWIPKSCPDGHGFSDLWIA
jgi:hypothetical protein